MTRTGDCLLWSITRLWLMLYHCQDMLLNKTLIGRWCETSWQSCGVNVLTMLQYAFSVHVLQMITCSMGEFRCFPCCQPGHAAEQTVERSVIWNVMTLMCVIVITMLQLDFGITNCYVANKKCWMFPLLSAWTRCWRKQQNGRWFETSWRSYGVIVEQCYKMRFRYHKWFTSSIREILYLFYTSVRTC